MVRITRSFQMAPPAGLEPATTWLTVRCSANWAKEEYYKLRGFPQLWETSLSGRTLPEYSKYLKGAFEVSVVSLLSRLPSQQMHIENRTKGNEAQVVLKLQGSSSSPRSISIVQLNTLLHLHPRPIKLVVYKWPYLLKAMGYLILRCSSHLDAFSVYNIRTRLLSYALGSTTDAPEVRPTRSSRTKVSSSQISNAHDR